MHQDDNAVNNLIFRFFPALSPEFPRFRLLFEHVDVY